MLGIIGLALAGLVILWVSMTPDLAEARLTATGFRRSVYRLLSGHWHGTKRQWTYQKAWLAMLGAFYFMLLIFMHFTISTDYAMSMIAGWKDSIFPVVYSLTGFQSSLGLVLVILFILRRWGGYHTYIGISPFWSASKLVLAFSLLWCYHMFAFGITYWYGRLEVEQNILQYLLFKSYGGMFAANFLLSFVMPFLLLLWNPVRRSDWGPALAGMIVLAGAFVFNLRIFVASFNAGDVYAHFLADVPPPVYPALWDVFIVLGGLGLVAFFYLLATRLFPLMCVWEIKEGTMYQKMGNFMRGRYLVLAKPE
jgi:molybdopterin-containing oxidoreductase family membrane subunit